MMLLINASIGDIHEELSDEEIAAKEAEHCRLELIDAGFYDDIDIPECCDSCGGKFTHPSDESKNPKEQWSFATFLDGAWICFSCENFAQLATDYGTSDDQYDNWREQQDEDKF